MIWLALSILCSTLIFLIFKLFPKYGINNLEAILINYFTATSVGLISGDMNFALGDMVAKTWFASAVFLGFLFISLFQLMALVSQRFGVTTVSVAVKMSLVIPVIFAMLYYGDATGVLKILGILLALVAVYLASYKPSALHGHASALWLPALLFIGSGVLDSLLKYNQHELVPVEEHAYFTSSIFMIAGIIGIFWLIISRIGQKTSLTHWKNIVAGIVLGIPNYGSIYFLIKALDMHNLESSIIFPVNNVGVVALSVISARLLFNEKLSRMNILGVILALLSIGLMTFVKLYA